MDQRRFIAFLMMSVGVLILFSVLFPPPPPAKKPAPPAGAQADAKQEAEKPADDVAEGANDAAQDQQAQDSGAGGERGRPGASRSAVATRFARLARSSERVSDAGHADQSGRRRIKD